MINKCGKQQKIYIIDSERSVFLSSQHIDTDSKMPDVSVFVYDELEMSFFFNYWGSVLYTSHSVYSSRNTPEKCRSLVLSWVLFQTLSRDTSIRHIRQTTIFYTYNE